MLWMWRAEYWIWDLGYRIKGRDEDEGVSGGGTCLEREVGQNSWFHGIRFLNGVGEQAGEGE
jgi:hypothetical protein